MGCCCGKAVVPQKDLEPVILEELRPSSPILPEEKPLPIVSKRSPVKWYYKVGISISDPLRLIRGYEEEPVVFLEEALKPFDGRIDDLAAQINQAKTNCYSSNPHGLTHDESAAIYLYSMQGDGDSVYGHLEKAWEEAGKANNRSYMVPWFRYLKLLRSALDKLPDAEGEVWQGTASDPDLAKTLRVGSSHFYSGLGSCAGSPEELNHDPRGKSEAQKALGPNKSTDAKEVAEHKKNDSTELEIHLEGDSRSPDTFVGYKLVDAKDVSGYTAYNKKESMIWPGVKLNIGKIPPRDKNGKLILHLTGEARKSHSDLVHKRRLLCVGGLNRS